MREISELVWHELRDDRLVDGLIALHLLVANAIQLPAGYAFSSLYAEYFASLFMLDIIGLPALAVIGLSLRSIVADPRHPAAWLRAVLDRRCAARILTGFAPLLALVSFSTTFTAMKSFIGRGGFTAHLPLADFDRRLHFGVDPAVLLRQVSVDASI
jgi:hypothetical protein